MASTKDKTVITILSINKEIRDYKDELKEYQEFIGYFEQIQSKTQRQFEQMAEARNTIKGIRAEIADLKSLRESEITSAGFKKADFGHQENNYQDATWYGAFNDLSQDIRNQYPSDKIKTENGKTLAQKYFALDNEDIRYANDIIYKAYQEKTKETPEWSETEIENFKANMGMTLDEWRATAKGIWAAR